MVRILVVDDDDAVREVLGESLEAAGHEVRTAADGGRAIRIAAEWPPDVVVTDIVMPEKEGLETIIELRRTHPAVRIIAISGGGVVGPDDYLVPAEGLGADRCLAKPFRLGELSELIEELLAER
jgi:CheY-like chemotaxis protein